MLLIHVRQLINITEKYIADGADPVVMCSTSCSQGRINGLAYARMVDRRVAAMVRGKAVVSEMGDSKRRTSTFRTRSCV